MEFRNRDFHQLFFSRLAMNPQILMVETLNFHQPSTMFLYGVEKFFDKIRPLNIGRRKHRVIRTFLFHKIFNSRRQDLKIRLTIRHPTRTHPLHGPRHYRRERLQPVAHTRNIRTQQINDVMTIKRRGDYSGVSDGSEEAPAGGAAVSKSPNVTRRVDQTGLPVMYKRFSPGVGWGEAYEDLTAPPPSRSRYTYVRKTTCRTLLARVSISVLIIIFYGTYMYVYHGLRSPSPHTPVWV